MIEMLHDLTELGRHAVADLGILAGPTPSPTGTPGGDLHTDNALTWIGTRIVPILLGVLGVVFIGRAQKGDVSSVMTSSAIAFIGIAFIVGATSLFFFGGSLINLLIGG